MEIKSNQCLISIHPFTTIPNLSARESLSWLHEYVHHYIPLHPEKLANVLIIILQSAFHNPVFQLWIGSWALKDHFTLRIAWVLERELKRVGLMASRKLQATWDPSLVLLPCSFDWQLQFRNCVVPLPVEAALALGLQERREGLSVTKPVLLSGLSGWSGWTVEKCHWTVIMPENLNPSPMHMTAFLS